MIRMCAGGLFKGLVPARISRLVEELLRKESDFVGYAADDEESPL